MLPINPSSPPRNPTPCARQNQVDSDSGTAARDDSFAQLKRRCTLVAESREAPTNHLHRHTIGCILQVRSIFHTDFGLPAEIISIILDHAAYWVSSITVLPVTPQLIWGGVTLIRTPPLGIVDSRKKSENKQLESLVRGLNPCREIRVNLKGNSVRRKVDWIRSFAPTNLHSQTPGNRPLVMSVFWGLEGKNVSGRGEPDRIFEAPNFPSVIYIESEQWHIPRILYLQSELHHEIEGCDQPDRPRIEEQKASSWSIPVFEGTLSRAKEEEKAVVWRWTDRNAGGDLLRALRVGDSLELRSNHPVFGWGTFVSYMEIEILYAM